MDRLSIFNQTDLSSCKCRMRTLHSSQGLKEVMLIFSHTKGDVELRLTEQTAAKLYAALKKEFERS